jgi:hypothetical protein
MTDWFQTSGTTSKIGNQKVTAPAFLMKEFLEGRKNQEAYTAFFDHFVPCATKKTTWDRRLAKTETNLGSSSPKRLCSVSDEAFALLLLENSFERWLDLFSNHKGPVMQQRGVRQREFQSDVPTMYTRGGIKYENTKQKQSEKGWSADGIVRFNALFDQVKRDRAGNPNFEVNWLRMRRNTQAEEGATPKKRKLQQPQARSELFESDNEDNIAPTTTEEPFDESGSDTDDDETDSIGNRR